MLNRQYPFFARIVLSMTRHEVKDNSNSRIKTMGINQYGHLYYSPNFVSQLTQAELLGVLAHECCHVAFLTFQREKTRDHDVWNIATDIAINWIIVNAGMTLPAGDLIPDSDGTMRLPAIGITMNVADMSAEQIYQCLEQHANKTKQYHTMDTHLSGDEDGEGGHTGDATESGAVDKNKQRWKQTCANAAALAKTRGGVGSAIERMLHDILNPKLNWKELLNRYISKELPYNYTYARPGKKSHATGFYMPHTLKENLNIVICRDVSGSVGEKEDSEFMSEILGICTAYEQVNAIVIPWSASIFPEDVQTVTRDSASELMKYRVKTTGGTEISCVARYIEENNIQPRICIYLTDGYVEQNPILPDCVNICVISSNGSEEILEKAGAIVCSLNDDGN
jgi:predicted metal-dependent peptidase